MDGFQVQQMKQQRFARLINMLNQAGQQERAQKIVEQNYGLQLAEQQRRTEGDIFGREMATKADERAGKAEVRAQGKYEQDAEIYPIEKSYSQARLDLIKKQTAQVGATHAGGAETTPNPEQPTNTLGWRDALAMRKQWFDEAYDVDGNRRAGSPDFGPWFAQLTGEEAGGGERNPYAGYEKTPDKNISRLYQDYAASSPEEKQALVNHLKGQGEEGYRVIAGLEKERTRSAKQKPAGTTQATGFDPKGIANPPMMKGIIGAGRAVKKLARSGYPQY